MKSFLVLFLSLVAMGAIAQVAAPTASVSWSAPTTNTDGSKITGALTFTLYQATQGGTLAAVAKGLTATSNVVTAGLIAGSTQCFAVTATVGGLESSQTAPACVAIPLPSLIPGAPTQVSVTLR